MHWHLISAAAFPRQALAAIALASVFTAAGAGPKAGAAPGAPFKPAPMAPAEWCKRLATRVPGTSAQFCQNSALQAKGTLSRNGFPILERDISAAAPQAGVARTGNKKAP